ncbi:MAG TPA: 2'-5' RNA ligase family protein [Kineosporiaceae bacterium]|nr:2'-5' RNA ligase family protein [Kineosporiaceae bacterium]
MPNLEGETALVVVADAAEPAVARWRSTYDGSASAGIPAHVTLLYPFLPLAEVTPDVMRHVRRIVAAEPAFEVTFACLGRFSGSVLWLAPEPAEPFRRLTYALWDAWPQTPPYGGLFEEVTPHLTVAEDAEPDVLDEITAEIAQALPLSMPVTHAQLLGVRDGRWTRQATFPLGPSGVDVSR